MKPDRVEILERELCYQGFFRREKLKVRHALFGGGMSPPIVREIVERGDVVAVLLYDPDRDEVVMIEQFRVGALAHARGPWLLEVVAGMVEPGEAAQDVARREALEEAGLVVGELIHVTDFFATPAKSSEHSTLFCGRVDASNAGGVHGLAAEGEDIRVVVMALDEALAALTDGRVNSAWPMIALYWLQHNRTAVRARWK